MAHFHDVRNFIGFKLGWEGWLAGGAGRGGCVCVCVCGGGPFPKSFKIDAVDRYRLWLVPQFWNKRGAGPFNSGAPCRSKLRLPISGDRRDISSAFCFHRSNFSGYGVGVPFLVAHKTRWRRKQIERDNERLFALWISKGNVQ